MLLIRLFLGSIKKNLILFLKSLVCITEPTQHLKVYKSFVFNLRAFGFKTALKLPVFIFSNTKILSVGKIRIFCEMTPGLICIGKADSKSQGCSKFSNEGELLVKGPVIIGGCTSFSNSGTITFDGYNLISEGCTVVIKEKLTIGKNSRVGFHSFVMDSDEHFTIDVEKLEVYPYTRPIVIGRFNWIGSYTYIKKGTKTPDYMIVASPNALLCKDYTEMPPYSVMGGSPARLIKSGIRRIFNYEQQQKLEKFFSQERNAKKYTFDQDINLDVLCAD